MITALRKIKMFVPKVKLMQLAPLLGLAVLLYIAKAILTPGYEGWCDTIWRNSLAPRWSAHSPDGTYRVFKKPNYYGFGSPSPWHYGEPYYARSVKY